ncbi:ParB/RepB/Spo0J family partition protein [Stackebrandtia nassauensis]|uniref:ParB-like partition protein n=1 Tax=Stackebrandtia nassauensis (strain DSM 44728 / CIP 108903 / NRRL B-16338 / NBRC 102104 / LLR-40K-21) TaxID=446470 RepID=D3PV13_STANL|nr:ParB/RepB/Spo0J family partition protein [Stackebrandtia nassauensis]ADD45037.1 parB-like partition protein [Stackebrandtia nassauensis DSM 44728]
MEIVELDIEQLIPNPDNRPSDAEPDISDLLDSIPIVGLLQPIVAVPTEEPGQHMVVAGHRRRLALIALKHATAPCVIAADADAAQLVASRLAENLNREAMRPTDEARDYEQLALFGWKPERIAKVAGRSKKHVAGALALSKLPEAAQQAADDGTLDLALAAEVAEFAADDPKAMERILKGASSHWGARHAIDEEKRKRDKKDTAEKLKAQLVLDGVRVTTIPKGFPWTSKEAEASTLRDADGNALDPEVVKTQPGFRAFVDPLNPAKPVVYCTDPEAWGFTRTKYTSYVSEAEAQQRAEAEAEDAARAEAHTAARAIRHEFLKQRYATAKAAKPLFPDALRTVIARPSSMDWSYGFDDLADALAGASIAEAVETAGIDRLTRMLVARWLVLQEANLKAVTSGKRLSDERRALAYLDLLVDDGYTLSDIEQHTHERLTAAIAAEEAELAAQDQAEQDQADSTHDDAADGDAAVETAAA